MSNADLSPTMKAALEACKTAGALWRWPGGFWVARVKPHDRVTPANGEASWSAQTIWALIDRKAVSIAGRSGTYGGGSYICQVVPVLPHHQS